MCLGGIRLSLLHMFYVVYRNDGPPWLGSVKLLRCTDNSSGARTSRPCQVCSDLFYEWMVNRLLLQVFTF